MDKNVRQSSQKLKKINYAKTNNEVSSNIFKDYIRDKESVKKGEVSTPIINNNCIKKSCYSLTDLSLQFKTKVSQDFNLTQKLHRPKRRVIDDSDNETISETSTRKHHKIIFHHHLIMLLNDQTHFVIMEMICLTMYPTMK